MTKLTPEGWAKCLIILRAVYQNSFKIEDKNDALVWFEMLNDLPEVTVIEAVKHLSKTQKAFPAIADIRNICEAPMSASWSEAWAEICEKAHKIAYPVFSVLSKVRPATFSSPLVEQAFKEFGGANAILNMLESDIPTHRAQFRMIYENVQQRAKLRSLPALSNPPELKVLKGGQI